MAKQETTQRATLRRKLLIMATVTIICFGGAVIWFDYLQLLNIGVVNLFRNYLTAEGRVQNVNANERLLLDKERLSKRELAIEREREELDRRERIIEHAENTLSQRLEELIALQDQLDQQEITLISDRRLYENRREVLETNVRQLYGIPPEDAAKILEGYDDQLIIETFQLADEIATTDGTLSLVPLWLSLLPPERAAAIQRKSVIQYGDQ